MQADLGGPAGKLEALLEEPAGPGPAAFAAVICHPHPLFGGTMHTHAAYRLAKAVQARGGAALRFNFRGVGRSAGRYAGGEGEAEDARAALGWLAGERPGLPLLACGFSFGSWMALLAGGPDPRVRGLLLAGVAFRGADLAPQGAPRTDRGFAAGMGLDAFRDSGRLREVAKPLAVVQAERDEFGPPEEVLAALEGSRGPRRTAVVRGATHLFTEDLAALQREAEASVGWLLGEGRA